MTKTRVVLFHPHKAEILINPVEADYQDHPKYAVNPDLSEVIGQPPHRWDLLDGRVVMADLEEIERREKVLTLLGEGPSKASTSPIYKTLYVRTPFWHQLAFLALSLLGSYLMARFL